MKDKEARWCKAWFKMRKQRTKYRKALDEIKKLLEQKSTDDFGNYVYGISPYFTRTILDIINKAKEQ